VDRVKCPKPFGLIGEESDVYVHDVRVEIGIRGVSVVL
jgi:hypothetical protein